MEEYLNIASRSLKAFSPGQEAYVAYLYRGRNGKPKIKTCFVEKVGRKYVTCSNGYRYAEDPNIENGLKEDGTYGTEGYLFATLQEAKEFIEKHNLELWLANLKPYGKFSLQQLRRVKAILDVEV